MMSLVHYDQHASLNRMDGIKAIQSTIRLNARLSCECPLYICMSCMVVPELRMNRCLLPWLQLFSFLSFLLLSALFALFVANVFVVVAVVVIAAK